MKLDDLLNGMEDIKKGIDVVRGGMGTLTKDVKKIKKGASGLKEGFDGLKSDAGAVKNGIKTRSNGIAGVGSSINNLMGSVVNVVSDLTDVAGGVADMKKDIDSINKDIPTESVENTVADNMRRSMRANDTRRDEGLTTPDGIERFDDILYGKDPVWQILDVYRPEEAMPESVEDTAKKTKLPVIINVHGGGWVYGTKETYQFYCMWLAKQGFAVINYTYRLAPEVKFPAPIEDLNLVVKWMKRNASLYGFDIKKVFLVGDSAGGNLAGLYACMCTNEKYAAKYSFKVPKNFKPAGLCLNCGAYDPANFISERELMTGLVLKDKSLLNDGTINVTDNMTEDFPPTYIMSATGDFCLKYFEPMVKCLTSNGIQVESRIYGDSDNKLGHVFHLDTRSEYAAVCNEAEIDFIRRLCGMKSIATSIGQ